MLAIILIIAFTIGMFIYFALRKNTPTPPEGVM